MHFNLRQQNDVQLSLDRMPQSIACKPCRYPIPSTRCLRASRATRQRPLQKSPECRAIHTAMADLSEEKFIWEHNFTRILIQLYKQHPVLYATDHVDYKNRGKRLDALYAIKKEMHVRGIKLTTADIKKKIHGLRTQYGHQLAKMKKDERFRTTLWCFHLLDFLKNNYDVSAELDNESGNERLGIGEQSDDIQFQDMESLCDDLKEEAVDTSTVTEIPFFTTSNAYQKEGNDDDIKTFGKLVELELRKITHPQLLRKAKKEILNVLMDAQEGCEV